MEPKVVTFQFLREITGNFSKERIIGQDLHANVYRGVTIDGEVIAVKILHDRNPGLDDKQVQDDLRNLSMLKHQNLVRFKGYCPHVPEASESAVKFWLTDGNTTTSTIAVCLEYLCNGTLQKHLSDEFNGIGWHMRYRIIKGICEGLDYIHKAFERPIYHLDLKPNKILLDKDMEPKISILSLSKSLVADLSQITCLTDRRLKYYAPEYLRRNIVSDKADVFSLGVLMIELVTGPTMEYINFAGMSPQEIIDLAEQNWKRRLQETSSRAELIFFCKQAKRWTEIASSCVDSDRHKRPGIRKIIKLITTEYADQIDWQDVRMDDIYVELNFLARAIDGCEKPRNLQLRVLQIITKSFSDVQKIGHGGCGVVYKGILPNGIVAVKRLLNSRTIEDRMFHQEVGTMMMAQHQNIVRCLGYCSHTEEHAVKMAGLINMAQIRERLLCLEYINNGSLENHLNDELRGLEWHTRYQIIKGICEGLKHLHMEIHIIHMDLKPANILLDDHMVPKITDFGLSRIIDEKSRTTSRERLMSLGYCAPEYQYHGRMSAKSDIYSLGIMIIELITGSKEKPSIFKVLRRWRHRWNKSGKHTPLLWSQQVTKCLDLALSCVHTDFRERPHIWDIISELNEMDSTDSNTTEPTPDQIVPCLEDMLGIEPLDVHLRFELNKELPCSIELTNNTNYYIGFRISTTSLRQYRIHPSNKGIVPPGSKCSATIILQALKKIPPRNYRRDEFSVQSTRVDGSLTAADITGDKFSEHPGKVVDDVNLVVVLDAPQLPGDE